MEMDEMKRIVEEKVVDLMNQFKASMHKACVNEFKMPDEVIFTQRGKIAGVCYFNYCAGTGYLNFNPILMKENFEEFLSHTVVHEVSHYCVSLLKGRIMSGRRRVIHGKDWKEMMTFFGLNDAKRCHSYNTSNSTTRIQRRWKYKCECGTHMVSTTMHNKIRKGSILVCCSCDAVIKYIGV